jgi:tellurite resistance protein TerC
VLFESVAWISYPFGALLVLSGVRLAFEKEKEPDLESKLTVRVFRRMVPTTPDFEGTRFVVRRAGKLLATPLLMVLVVLDITDVVFAVDSVPAVFSVTHDPYLVFTSNIAAVLGLRSLYFLVSGAVVNLRFLKPGLSVILAFVGAKMFLHDLYEVPTLASLGVIVGVIAIAGVASSLFPEPRDHSEGPASNLAAPPPSA